MSKHDQRCETCRYWSMYDETELAGECHRYAPRPSKDEIYVWPTTYKDDFCGDWGIA